MGQNEARSETERHWDNVATTTITLATAAVAAVFLIMGNGQQEPDPAGDLDLFNAIMALFASGLYLAVAGIAGVGIFSGDNLSGEQRALETATDTRGLQDLPGNPGRGYNIALTTFTLPGLQSWYQQQEPRSSSMPTAGSGAPVP